MAPDARGSETSVGEGTTRPRRATSSPGPGRFIASHIAPAGEKTTHPLSHPQQTHHTHEKSSEADAYASKDGDPPGARLPLGLDLHRQQQHTARLVRQLQRQSVCRNDLLLLRSQVQSAWERFYRYQLQYEKSKRLYEEEMIPFRFRMSGIADMGNLESLRRRFDDDREQLEQRWAEATGLESQLILKDKDLIERETVSTDAANALIKLLRGEHAFTPSPPSLPPMTPRLDPKLENYFDKAGDVKVMCERLLDLDQWRQETLATRQLLADQGNVLPLSDEDFEKDYARKRAVIEEEVNLVIAEADRLREICEEAGLDVTAYLQTLPASGDAAAVSSSIGEDIVPLEIGPALIEPMEVSIGERGTEDIIDAILDGPKVRSGPTGHASIRSPRVAHWIEDLLQSTGSGFGEHTAPHSAVNDIADKLDLAGSTAVPSMTAWSQSTPTHNILTTMADAQRSKSDTLVTIIGQDRTSDDAEAGNIRKNTPT